MPLYNNPLIVPRKVLSSGTRLTTAAAASTNYMMAEGTFDVLAATTTTVSGATAWDTFDYVGTDWDFPGTTQRWFMDAQINTATNPTGTCTISCVSVTQAANVFVIGSAALNSGAISLAASSELRYQGKASSITKPADGRYKFIVSGSAIPAANYVVTAQLYIYNV